MVNRLQIAGVSYQYGSATVLHSISTVVDGPELIALIGPNGAGKSTLIGIIAGQLQGYEGTCYINGEDIRTMSRRRFCREVAHIPQQRIHDVPFTVEDVILTGRTPYSLGLFETEQDLAAVETAMRLTRLERFRDRKFSTLSGGEQQRVLVAAAVAQSAYVLMLDEPGAHLDPENQTALWGLLERLRGDGKSVIIVTHQLNLAFRADRVWLLSEGRLVADERPSSVMRPELLQTVFHAPFHLHSNEQGRVFLNYG